MAATPDYLKERVRESGEMGDLPRVEVMMGQPQQQQKKKKRSNNKTNKRKREEEDGAGESKEAEEEREKLVAVVEHVVIKGDGLVKELYIELMEMMIQKYDPLREK